MCFCDEGYTYDSDTDACVDIDECATDSITCHENAECVNEVGSAYCECKLGYLGDGVNNCEDDDECFFLTLFRKWNL